MLSVQDRLTADMRFHLRNFNAMRPQIESLMNKAGLEVNLRNLNNAQDLINNNIPVTEKTFKI